MNWKPALIIIATMALGMLLINQTFGWYYKAEFLKTPCKLCEELNPHLKECFGEPRYVNTITGEEIDINLSINMYQPLYSGS